MDFFSVPTFTFNVLYVFFLIGHNRRRILHFNVTRHPTSAWIVQQVREAFPYEPATKFLVPTENSIALKEREHTREGTNSSVSESTCRIAEL